MDSDRCSGDKYANAIMEHLRSGKLTPQEAAHRLSIAIDRELEKPPAEIRESFIRACTDLMHILSTPEEYVSQADFNKKQLGVKIRKVEKRREMTKRVLITSGIAASILVGVMIGDGILRREWLDGRSTEDQQQFEVVGTVIDPNLVDSGIAAPNDSLQAIESNDLAEISEALGYMPPFPEWCPDGWTSPTLGLNSHPEFLWFFAEWHNEDIDGLLKYEVKWFNALDGAKEAFEQNEHGQKTTINGMDVYFTENIEKSMAVWWEGKTYCTIHGPVSYDTLYNMIESINKGEEP